MGMTRDQFLGIVRHVLTFAGGYLVAKGVLDESLFLEITSAAVSLAGLAWSLISKKKVDGEG